MEKFADLGPDELISESFWERVDSLVLVDTPRTENRSGKSRFLALRDLAIGLVVSHSEARLARARERNGVQEVRPVRERILVCVGPSPTSESLIRETRRMARNMNASWIALHLSNESMTAAQRERAGKHLDLAETLGAEVRRVTAPVSSEVISEFALRENVTKVVFGRSETSEGDGLGVFSVEDEGPGLEPEFEKRMFDRFSRAREIADGGSGLL